MAAKDKLLIRHVLQFDVNPDNFGLPENLRWDVYTPSMHYHEGQHTANEIVDFMKTFSLELTKKLNDYNKMKRKEQDIRNLERNEDDKDPSKDDNRFGTANKPARGVGRRGSDGD